MTRGLHRRQTTTLTPGLATTGTLFFLFPPPTPASSSSSQSQIPREPQLRMIFENSRRLRDRRRRHPSLPHHRIPSAPRPPSKWLPPNLWRPTRHGRFHLPRLSGVKYIIPALNSLGGKYTAKEIKEYLPTSFTTTEVLPAYAKKKWQAGLTNCPVGEGVGE